ncbi:MAG: hypothetical protein H5U24_14935 [Thioclava marina]|jgi:hypothetical protein|uniref:Lipoprotein n=1 Tax=Thioclava marina TaxID=1915077 RepID=A0ABX3MPL7_9RHOB|nr:MULTISPECIES: hypothetical protein [Thioclava]TNE93043.1 MAG: hypothetical protein EP337_04495 [Paracoccaceae bacterium]MBC7146679.1 hypothetical protein [Thioclava marina]MBD3804093.1 hypothetical protein [Thioclava sp.]OOY13170.1 hypothetical protein BMG00_05060 [Thioclava marina]OOY28882.1 hypothetical protein BMI90_00960 [Thioclava sp. L04-15]
MRALALIASLAMLTACSKHSSEDYPALLPLDQILDDQPLSPDPAPDLEARAAALKARADMLRADQSATTSP